MGFVVDLKTEVQHKMVFELRYERGELYWDRCGRIARKLAAREEWSLDTIDTNGCHIRKEDQNIVFSFAPTKLDLVQSQSQDLSDLMTSGEFSVIAEEFSEVVVETLELDFFPRIGFRLWSLYPTDSIDDAASRISKMSFFTPRKSLTDLGRLSYISPSVVIERPNHMVRVATTPFEQLVKLAPSVITAARAKAREHWTDQKKVLIQKIKASKTIKAYPSLGIMVDMDAFIEDSLYPKQLAIHTFIENAMNDFHKISMTILSEDGKI